MYNSNRTSSTSLGGSPYQRLSANNPFQSKNGSANNKPISQYDYDNCKTPNKYNRQQSDVNHTPNVSSYSANGYSYVSGGYNTNNVSNFDCSQQPQYKEGIGLTGNNMQDNYNSFRQKMANNMKMSMGNTMGMTINSTHNYGNQQTSVQGNTNNNQCISNQSGKIQYLQSGKTDGNLNNGHGQNNQNFNNNTNLSQQNMSNNMKQEPLPNNQNHNNEFVNHSSYLMDCIIKKLSNQPVNTQKTINQSKQQDQTDYWEQQIINGKYHLSKSIAMMDSYVEKPNKNEVRRNSTFRILFEQPKYGQCRHILQNLVIEYRYRVRVVWLQNYFYQQNHKQQKIRGQQEYLSGVYRVECPKKRSDNYIFPHEDRKYFQQCLKDHIIESEKLIFRTDKAKLKINFPINPSSDGHPKSFQIQGILTQPRIILNQGYQYQPHQFPHPHSITNLTISNVNGSIYFIGTLDISHISDFSRLVQISSETVLMHDQYVVNCPHICVQMKVLPKRIMQIYNEDEAEQSLKEMLLEGNSKKVSVIIRSIDIRNRSYCYDIMLNV